MLKGDRSSAVAEDERGSKSLRDNWIIGTGPIVP